MAHKYRRSRNDFFLFGDQHTIRETEYGIGNHGNVYYPGVSSCTTITLLLNDNTVLGAHFAKIDELGDVNAIVTELNNVRAGRAVSKMFMVGALKARGTGFVSDQRYKWPQQLTTFNTLFGRNPGDIVLGYDQGLNADLNYRAQRAGDTMVWFKKATAVALDAGGWEPIQELSRL